MVIPWADITQVALPEPVSGQNLYVGVIPHYTDASVGLPDFLGSWTVSLPVRVIDCMAGPSDPLYRQGPQVFDDCSGKSLAPSEIIDFLTFPDDYPYPQRFYQRSKRKTS